MKAGWGHDPSLLETTSNWKRVWKNVLVVNSTNQAIMRNTIQGDKVLWTSKTSTHTAHIRSYQYWANDSDLYVSWSKDAVGLMIHKNDKKVDAIVV